MSRELNDIATLEEKHHKVNQASLASMILEKYNSFCIYTKHYLND